MRASLLAFVLCSVVGCSQSAGGEVGDAGDTGDTGTSVVSGATCDTEGATAPTSIACMCGGTMASTCNCVAGRWQCPSDCYPEPNACDAGSHIAPDADPTDSETTDTGVVSDECRNAQLPRGACTIEGDHCNGSAYCNGAIPLSCTCESGHWVCDRNVCI